jgi:uncharacterized OsmC-like protein
VTRNGKIRETQRRLRESYAAEPAGFVIRLRVQGGSGDLADPLHADVRPVSIPGTTWKSGAHPAVGGDGDAPCSADLLLGALAACQEITLRMVAANMGIELEELQIDVEGDWDPRGTLAMGKEFPIGLTGIRCRTRVKVREDEPSDRTDRLLRSAERYCVVLDTLRHGLPVETTFELQAKH